MVTDILHDEGPLTGLTPVNVHRAVYTETIITRGAAEQLSVCWRIGWSYKNHHIFIYRYIFCEGNVSKAQKRFLFKRCHLCAPTFLRSNLIQPPDEVATDYILIYRGGREAVFIASSWKGLVRRVEQHMHKHQSVSAGSCSLAPARKQHAGRAVRLLLAWRSNLGAIFRKITEKKASKKRNEEMSPEKKNKKVWRSRIRTVTLASSRFVTFLPEKSWTGRACRCWWTDMSHVFFLKLFANY